MASKREKFDPEVPQRGRQPPPPGPRTHGQALQKSPEPYGWGSTTPHPILVRAPPTRHSRKALLRANNSQVGWWEASWEVNPGQSSSSEGVARYQPAAPFQPAATAHIRSATGCYPRPWPLPSVATDPGHCHRPHRVTHSAAAFPPAAAPRGPSPGLAWRVQTLCGTAISPQSVLICNSNTCGAYNTCGATPCVVLHTPLCNGTAFCFQWLLLMRCAGRLELFPKAHDWTNRVTGCAECPPVYVGIPRPIASHTPDTPHARGCHACLGSRLRLPPPPPPVRRSQGKAPLPGRWAARSVRPRAAMRSEQASF